MTTEELFSDSRARWKRDIEQYNLPHARLRAISQLVRASGRPSVLDVGCAGGILRDLLPESISYRGIDFVGANTAARPDLEIATIDLNSASLPGLHLEGECIVLSGILEYIRDPERLFSWLLQHTTAQAPMFILSYFNDAHISRRLKRLIGHPVPSHPDWVPLLTYGELMQTLRLVGLDIRSSFSVSRGLRGSPRPDQTRESTASMRPVRRLSNLGTHQWAMTLEMRSKRARTE